MRQLLGESTLLALAGSGLGVLLCRLGERLPGRRLDVASEAAWPSTSDWVLRLHLAVSFAAARSVRHRARLAGLPHRRQHRPQAAVPRRLGDRSRHRFRQALIAAEIAFALVLLTGADFFIRGLQRAPRDPG